MDISSIEVDITIIQGKGLVAKDRNRFGKKTRSDPYIVVQKEGSYDALYTTKTIKESLDPQWNESFKLYLSHALDISGKAPIKFHIFDHDKLTSRDSMGTVTIKLPDLSGGALVVPHPWTEWYPVESGREDSKYYCEDAKGQLQISVALSVRKVLNLKRGNVKALSGTIQLKLMWDLEKKTDLDTSCVAIDKKGNILMDETVYFGDLVNSNGSITHSGDTVVGGSGKGEVITCKLNQIKQHVHALYFILSVATPEHTFQDVESSEIRVRDMESGVDVCTFTPTFAGNHTSMFLMRLARVDAGVWKMTVIEDTDHTGELYLYYDYKIELLTKFGYSLTIYISCIIQLGTLEALFLRSRVIREISFLEL